MVLAVRRGRVGAPLDGSPEVVSEPADEPAPARSRFHLSRRWVAASVVVVLVVVSGATAFVLTRPDGSACLSSPAVYPDSANEYVNGMPREILVEDLPAPGRLMKVGDLLELGHDAESRHDVSVLGADDLEPTADLRPADGRRLVSVSLQERNMGRLTIIAQVRNYTWLCDAEGTWYQHDLAMTRMLAGDDRLENREKVIQKVVFQIRADARPALVRTPANGHRSATTADWELD
ncbi:hypothetical protein [Pseudosporangium ferrugineum]|uniref:hypothetical protein n=1 Tax=Pseudosporangium ferrugineum TaxID=439699 RepID=UPI0011B1D480|nr:hypothetical protein [Pseudosporangium ferrugineum]